MAAFCLGSHIADTTVVTLEQDYWCQQKVEKYCLKCSLLRH